MCVAPICKLRENISFFDSRSDTLGRPGPPICAITWLVPRTPLLSVSSSTNMNKSERDTAAASPDSSPTCTGPAPRSAVRYASELSTFAPLPLGLRPARCAAFKKHCRLHIALSAMMSLSAGRLMKCTIFASFSSVGTSSFLARRIRNMGSHSRKLHDIIDRSARARGSSGMLTPPNDEQPQSPKRPRSRRPEMP
jgi:hypothetical protein